MIEQLNKIIDDYKENIIKDTQKLISFNSIYEECDVPGQPFGPEIASALECALEMAEDMGFKTRNVDGYMGEIDYGNDGKKIGMIAHIDIVPAGEGWIHDPFAGEVEDGKLYGRGSIDDKGPLVAALYAMKAIKESGLPCKNHVRFLIGCDEESGFRCIKYYLTKEKQPWGGFSPDGEFPVIFGEKGIYRFQCHGTWEESQSEEGFNIVKITGGTRMNVVPGEAIAILCGNSQLFTLAEQALKEYNPENRLSFEIDGKYLKIKAQGVSAHSSMPWNGVNANNILLNYLRRLPFSSASAKQYIYALADLFADGYSGINLGIACENEIFGELTLSLGIMQMDGNGGKALFDMRYPNLNEREILWNKITLACNAHSIKLIQLQDKPGLHVPQDSELIKSLLKAYVETSGRNESPITIGGGTYSRSMENFVGYGPLFPGQKEMAHECDEYIGIDDLILCTKIYAQALYSLMK